MPHLWGIFCIMNYELHTVAGLGTAITTLDGGEKLAALLLPSFTEYKYSASKVKVTLNNIIIQNDCAFIKPPSWDEFVNPHVMQAMGNNVTELHTMDYDDFLDKLKAWIFGVIEEHDAKYIRLCYGGDLYTIANRYETSDLLRDLNTMLRRHLPGRDIVLIFRTAHIEQADTELSEMQRLDSLDKRLVIVAETQTYNDMPLFIQDRVRYYWEGTEPDNAVEDIKAIPVSAEGSGFFRKEVAIRIPEGAYKLFSK